MKRDKIQNSIIKFKDNDINSEYIECHLDSCNDIKTKGNDNNEKHKSNDNKMNMMKIMIMINL